MRLSSVSRVLLAVWVTVVCTAFTPLSAAPVNKAEAIAVGDLWHAMEVNSRHSKLSPEQKATRISGIPSRQVLEINDQYSVSATGLADGKALTYIITYPPSGWVVVSGDDRLHPVLAHDLESSFTWEFPERNFLRHFVTATLTDAKACWQLRGTNAAELPPHKLWTLLRRRLQEGAALNTAAFEDLPRLAQEKPSPGPLPKDAGVFIQMDTALWDQGQFYNDVCVQANGNNPVPTGCVATGAAIKMRYHLWPPSGLGSHAYRDSDGSIQFSHYADFFSSNYDWANMPTSGLTGPNSEVAKIMYHCGVMVDMDYELGGSGAQTYNIARANQYFRYRGAEGKDGYDKDAIIASVRAYLPVNIGGGSHSVVVDGYRNTPSEEFHINAGWSGQCNGWYTVGVMPTDSNTCSTSPIGKCVPYMAPDIYRYVDGEHRELPDGTLQNAYETLTGALNNVPAGGQVWLKAGTYTAPATIAQAVTLKPYFQGSVTLAR